MTVWEFTLKTLAAMGLYKSDDPVEKRRVKKHVPRNAVERAALENRAAIVKQFKNTQFTKHQVSVFLKMEPASVNSYLRTLVNEGKIFYAEKQVGNAPAIYRVSSK